MEQLETFVFWFGMAIVAVLVTQLILSYRKD
jgi:hypothetical protein